MAASPNVGSQLTDMLNSLKHYKETTSSAGPQGTDLSFMTLLWPLLPLLPPEPPTLLTELLSTSEKCDICGTSQSTPLMTCTKTPKGDIELFDTAGTSLRLRGVADWKTPLDRLMMDIENKMDETLNSIHETADKNTELSQKANEIEQAQMGDMTDAELITTLKKLTKVKADRMEKVKILEVKEQQLKESLTNAIDWAKSVELHKDNSDGKQVTIQKIEPEKDSLAKDERGNRNIG